MSQAILTPRTLPVYSQCLMTPFNKLRHVLNFHCNINVIDTEEFYNRLFLIYVW